MTKEELKAELNLGLALFNSGRELVAIAAMIQPNEKVQCGVIAKMGKADGLLVATDKRVIFVSKVLFTSVVEEFYYNRISSVQFNGGILFDEMDLFFSGVKVRFHELVKVTGTKVYEYIRAQIHNYNNNLASSNTANTAPLTAQLDPMDQLEKLAGLRNKGIITEEEFKAKKQQLLGL